MPKNAWSFSVAPLPAQVGVTCWGHYGLPLVLFASAGADSLEPERSGLLQALAPLLDAGRIKVYAVDGTAMRLLLAGTATVAARIEAQLAFDDWVGTGLGPHIRRDCHSDGLELLACGCAYGAASALKGLLRSSQLFRGAIGLSGTYDLLPWVAPQEAPAHFSPLQWLEQLADGAQRASLQHRSVALACGAGDYEEPAASAAVAQLLRKRGIGARMDVWGPDFAFGFSSWRQMLPRLLQEWL